MVQDHWSINQGQNLKKAFSITPSCGQHQFACLCIGLYAQVAACHAGYIICKEFWKGNGVSFWPVLTLLGGGHFDSHLWSYWTSGFGIIIRWQVFLHIIISPCDNLNIRAWFKSTQEGQQALNEMHGGLSYEKIRRYNNSFPYVMAR